MYIYVALALWKRNWTRPHALARTPVLLTWGSGWGRGEKWFYNKPWSRRFPSCLSLLFQSESECEAFHMKITVGHSYTVRHNFGCTARIDGRTETFGSRLLEPKLNIVSFYSKRSNHLPQSYSSPNMAARQTPWFPTGVYQNSRRHSPSWTSGI